MSVLALKYQENNLIILDQIKFDKPSTQNMLNVFTKIQTPRKPLLVTTDYNENIFLSIRNIQGAINLDVTSINVLDIMNAHKLIITKDAIKKLEEVHANG